MQGLFWCYWAHQRLLSPVCFYFRLWVPTVGTRNKENTEHFDGVESVHSISDRAIRNSEVADSIDNIGAEECWSEEQVSGGDVGHLCTLL